MLLLIQEENEMNEITEFLLNNSDTKYREFQSKLIPNVNIDTIIGVRTPVLRKYAKQIKNTKLSNDFIKKLPHQYFEENNLHAFLLEQINDYDRIITELERFLPYIDNWATCDGLSPKILKNNIDSLKSKVLVWISSKHTYTVRFGILCIMRYFLDNETFDGSLLTKIAKIKTKEYYIKMMQAWFFATALAKQYSATIKLLEEGMLDDWVHNKAIQKAIESYRIDSDTKKYLRTLKKRSE